MISAPPPHVAAVFASYSPSVQPGLQALRHLIFAEAASLPQVGPLTEDLRWGQPAYLTLATGAGSTLRLGVPKSGGYAIYVHCQTSLIADLATLAGPELRFEGNRAVLFQATDKVPDDLIRLLIRRALTWHLVVGPRQTAPFTKG
jgi:Domain of unknown function (DU1801)